MQEHAYEEIAPGTAAELLAEHVCRSPLVYGLIDPDDAARVVRYVGYSSVPRARLAQHRSKQTRDNWRLREWLRGLEGRGAAPLMIVLEWTDYTSHGAAEHRWVRWLRARPDGASLLNIEAGGRSTWQVRHGLEKRPKLRWHKKQQWPRKSGHEAVDSKKPPPLSKWSPLLGSR